MRLWAVFASLLGLLLPAVAHAENFPTKPVTLYVPFAPGGGTDLSVRMLEESVSKALGQKLVIVNKTGTATIYQVVTGKPDGYTLVVGSTGNLAAVPHNPGAPYKLDDYVPVVQVTAVPAMLVTPIDSPYKSLQDVVAAARQGKSIKVGISPLGSISHLAMMQLEKALNVKFTYIPHKSNGDVMTAILGGHVDVGSVDVAAAGQRITSREVRGIAIYNPTRFAQYPDVKTVREQGADIGFFGFYNVILAPKGTPPDVVKRLHDAFKAALDDPAVIERAKALDLPIAYLNSEDSRKQIDRSYETFGELLGELGLKKE
jgi:tripartite-type tricarboxylate transporter receptor subunit TctC